MSKKRADRIGEVNFNTSNEKMTIIDYKSFGAITVQFDDGTVRKGASYHNFKKGLIRKPKSTKVTREEIATKEVEKPVLEVKPIPEPTQESIAETKEKDFFELAEAHRFSATTLAQETNKVPLACIVLCKEAVIDYLNFAVKDTKNDIRYLGKLAKEKGISVDARDLAWLHDFNFESTKDWMKPTEEDVFMAIKIANSVCEKVSA